MESNIRIANPRLVKARAKRKFSCNLLLLPTWLDRNNLEDVAASLELVICNLEPELLRYLAEDPQGRLTPRLLYRLLRQSGKIVNDKYLLVTGIDRALSLLSLPNARWLLYQEGGGAFWQWQSGDGRYYFIPWLNRTRPHHWPVELCMRWEA